MEWQETVFWKFILEKPGAATFVLVAGLAVLGGLWKIYTHFFPKAEPVATVATERIVDVLAAQLESANQREQEHQDQIRQLTEAVDALKIEGGKPEALPGISEALEHLEKGDTAAAEAVFEEVKARRKAEGEGALKEAAAAARHIGALAFLHDTDKALAAYREAVALDPDDPDGWNQLGKLLNRTGDIDGAIEACNHVLSLGNRTADRGLIAVATGALGILYMTRGEIDRAEEMFRESLALEEALGRREGMAAATGNLGILSATQGELAHAEEMFRKSLEFEEALGRKQGMASNFGNLGILYRTRGELDRAEEMYRKSLEIDEALGRKEGMANQYGNLGNLYSTRGKLDRAEEMYLKGLEIDEALGRKQGMASNYGDLGILYKTRGEFDRAEEMYRKAIDLFQQIGATPQVEQTERNLANLREAE